MLCNCINISKQKLMKMAYFAFFISILLYSSSIYGFNQEFLSFPDGFIIGSATSSYQIEGAWNTSDKGENVWDRQTHSRPDSIADKSNGDVACNSYHKYKEDVQLLRVIGVDFYRFSISWSRILPTGHANVVSKDGVKYYNKLIDELLKHNIKPMITLYHWDHPQVLEDMGGWTSEKMVRLFGDYARVIFKEFGDRVKMLTTINEPSHICSRYKDEKGILYFSAHLSLSHKLRLKKTAEYLCNYTMLKAHARAYHIYDREFRSQQNGKISIVIDTPYYFSKYKNDVESSDIAFQFKFGMYAHPIFSKKGDWPDVVKQRIDENSKFEKLPQSRLPRFSKKWISYIKGTADYLGLNHYTSQYAEPAPKPNDTMYENDHGLVFSADDKWPTSETGWLHIVPEGFFALLLKIKQEYNNPRTYITENGIPDTGTLEDNKRLEYIHSYMKAMLNAVNNHNCNVRGYSVWSLLDNFEWTHGYTLKFGIIHVDFNSLNRTRTIKKSAFWLKDIIHSRKLLPIK